MPHSNQSKEILNKSMKYKTCSDLDAIPNIKTESYKITLLCSRSDESLLRETGGILNIHEQFQTKCLGNLAK